MGGSPTKHLSWKYSKFALKLKNDYDIIHLMWPLTAYVFQYFNILLKKPHIITIHGDTSNERINLGKWDSGLFRFKLLQWIEKKAIQKADVVITVANAIKDRLINELKIKQGCFVVSFD